MKVCTHFAAILYKNNVYIIELGKFCKLSNEFQLESCELC